MTMSDQVIAVLDNLCAKFGIVIDWTSENVLPYAKELADRFIKYEICTSVIWCISVAILVVAAYKTYRYCLQLYKASKDKWSEFDWEFALIASVVTLAVLLFVACAVINTQILDIVECIILPEKVIFNYIDAAM